MKKCIRCRVWGRVQGVFFRASTRTQAQALNLTGWARNLPDGGVAVLACGEAPAVDALHAWLRHGPPAARVDGVDCMPADEYDCPADFTTG
jgi:acylphosphatase